MADQAERQVERLPEVATAAVVARYEQASRLLIAMIAGAIRRGALGTARERKKQLAAVERALEALRRDTTGLTAAGIADGYKQGAAGADLSVKANLPTRADELLAPAFAAGANRGAIQALQASAEHKLDEALEQVGRSAEDVFRKVGLEEVGTGITAGLSRRETSGRIATRLAEEGIGAFVDRAGRTWKLHTYSRMVARTTQREAASLGTVDRLLQVGLDLVKISDHNTKTPICKPYEGKVYSISGRSKRFPALKVLPPFHPNCEHVVGAAAENLEELGFEVPKPIEPEKEIPALADKPPAAPASAGKPSVREGVHNVEPITTKAGKIFHEDIDKGLAAIEKVHSFPEDLKYRPQIRTANMSRGKYGEHRAFFDRGPDGKAVSTGAEILVGRRALRGITMGGPDAGRLGDTKFNSTVHETGHYLDAVHLGDVHEPQGAYVGRRLTSRYASEINAESHKGWREAIENSEAGKRMIANGNAYIRDWTELWARSYEQWIGERAGDEDLKRQHRQWIDAERKEGKPYESYWRDPKDFAPIARELEKLFASRGLLKE